MRRYNFQLFELAYKCKCGLEKTRFEKKRHILHMDKYFHFKNDDVNDWSDIDNILDYIDKNREWIKHNIREGLTLKDIVEACGGRDATDYDERFYYRAKHQ